MNVSHVQRRLNSTNDNILCFLMVVYCNVFRKQLTDTLTSIIFTGSVQHQAVNAPHHLYSYMPHRPLTLTKYDFDVSCETPNRDHIIHMLEGYLVFWLCDPGGCQQRGRRTSPGPGSRRLCPIYNLLRSFDTFCPPSDRSFFLRS